MERKLTEGEKIAIAHCLRKVTEDYNLRIDNLLSGKEEEVLAELTKDRVNHLNNIAMGLVTLAVMIERSPVVITTTIDFPELL